MGSRLSICFKLARVIDSAPGVLGWAKGLLSKATKRAAPDVLFRLGRPAAELGKTFDHALSPQLYVEDVAAHYGINLRGSGQEILVLYDESLPSGQFGLTKKIEGGKIIRIGPDALVDQATTANTIAHELSHARDYLQGGSHKIHGGNESLDDGTVYGSGNALEDWINGNR